MLRQPKSESRMSTCVTYAALLAILIGAALTGTLQLTGALELAAEHPSDSFSPNLAGVPSEAASSAKLYATAHGTSIFALAGLASQTAPLTNPSAELAPTDDTATPPSRCCETPFGRAPPSFLN